MPAPEPPGPGGQTAGQTSADPAGDAVVRVQRFALTVIGTARLVLDAAEAVVVDRARLERAIGAGRHLAAALVADLEHLAAAGRGSRPADDAQAG